METTSLTSLLLKELSKAEMLYQSGRSKEELGMVADLFAEALEGEYPESVKQAFSLHRKRCTRFPTPAHILALLPECRIVPKQNAIPEKTSSPRLNGLGIVVRLALRGDERAKKLMDNSNSLTQEEVDKILQGACNADIM